MESHAFSLKRCILDAIFSGLIALIIFGPIAGVVLDGYSFNFDGQRLAWMVGIVMLARHVPSTFVPDEDQGIFIASVTLPGGAVQGVPVEAGEVFVRGHGRSPVARDGACGALTGHKRKVRRVKCSSR